MSEVQSILEALEKALHGHELSEDMCYGLRRALDGVPEDQHMAALKAMLGVTVC